jgi:hypothetical protein
MKTATQRELRNAHDKYIDDILLGDIHNEPKRFWSYLKGKRQDSQGVAPLRKTDGFLHNDAPTKAEILNQQFHSVYTKEDASNKPDMGNSPHQDMQYLNISEEGVRKLLKNIKVHKPVASLSGMTKISLVHCVCHQARCHRCTCHGRFVTLVVLLFSCVCSDPNLCDVVMTELYCTPFAFYGSFF